jgi:hypothetical protein
MSAQDEIIYPDPAIPQEAFDFLACLNKSSIAQLGISDIKMLKKPARTASGAQHLDAMDKISEQIRMRMHVNRQ